MVTLGPAHTLWDLPVQLKYRRIPFDGGHGAAAWFTHHFACQPAGGVAVAFADLTVLFQLVLAFEPDVGIYDTRVPQQDQPHIRPIRIIGSVLGVAIELGAVLSRELGDICDDFRPMPAVIVIHVGVGFHIDGIFQQGGKLRCSPAAAIPISRKQYPCAGILFPGRTPQRGTAPALPQRG